MQNSAPIRFLAAAGLAVSAMLSPALTLAAQSTPTPATKPAATPPASSTLPAAQPTTTPPPPPIPPTPSQLPPTHAQVTYTGGTLSISASNSSLNQILREISRETGIKISGGVTDERVFGQYGPDAPSQILSALLDGTGSNMLLVNGNGDTPAELILTPRQGGPTPPGPNSRASDDAPETPNPSNGESPETQAGGQPNPDQSHPVANPPITPGTADPAAAATDPSQQQSPNGVKTPQQIYDQLQRLRQQPPAANPQ
jgi:hypothetical protein